MKIKVLTYEVKINSKKENYYLLKCEDKHLYNLPSKLGTPVLNGKYDIEYKETEYPSKSAPSGKAKSKWIETFKTIGATVEQTQAVLGGNIVPLKEISHGTTLAVNSAIWENAVYLVGCFITGKEGDLMKASEMIEKVYNELVRIKGGK